MSYLLEMLGKGLDHELGDLLDRYYWAPPARPVDELAKLAAEHPDWPDIQLQLGLFRLRSSEVPAAIEHLGNACRRKPDYVAARLALAASLEESGQTAAALEQVRIANQVKPGEGPILFAAGFLYEKLQQPQQAAEYYRDVIARDGNFAAARQRLAAIDVLRGDLADAVEQYKALMKLLPQESWIRTALAHLYHRNGQFGLAVEEFECAIAMEPDNWSLVNDEVESLVADGQLREAIERLHSLLENQGPFADLHVRLADLYSQTGDDAGAMKHYDLALELQPNYLEAHVKLGTHNLLMGRWEQAAECFFAGGELNDRLLVNYVGMAVSHAAAGNREESANCLELASAIEPNSTLLLSEMARLQLKAAAADEYLRAFDEDEECLTGKPEIENEGLIRRQLDRHAEEIKRHGDYADLRYRYGVLLRAEGRLGEAMEQFATAVALCPTYAQAIIKLGITQQELGLGEQAIETLKKALDLKPEYVDLHYRLGLLYTNRAQFQEAVKEMEVAATGAPNNEQFRAGLALSLQNMGLMDKAAATWRSLWRVHHAKQQAED